MHSKRSPLPPAVPDALRDALAAGGDAASLLAALPTTELRALCRGLGVSPARSKAETIERLLAFATPTQPGGRRPFVAIDFETADNGRDSACAVALVRVEGGEVVRRDAFLVRPPRPTFLFTHIHGITWAQVRGEPTWGQLWPTVKPLLEGVDFLAAHNASFDRSVLRACCTAAGVAPPEPRFLCTVDVARKTWDLHPTKLPDVCRHLGLPLRHHDAASDAEACARIVLAARADETWA